MQHQPMITPALTKCNFPAWVASLRLQAGALGITAAVESSNINPDPLLIRKLAALTNKVLDLIPIDAQIETIHGTNELPLHPLLSAINATFNRTSAADHEPLELKASRTLLVNFDKLEDYSAEHKTI